MRSQFFEHLMASAAFATAAALAFVSLLLNDEHEITSGVLMGIAQFLLFAASVMHIDYKLDIFNRTQNSPSTTAPERPKP